MIIFSWYWIDGVTLFNKGIIIIIIFDELKGFYFFYFPFPRWGYKKGIKCKCTNIEFCTFLLELCYTFASGCLCVHVMSSLLPDLLVWLKRKSRPRSRIPTRRKNSVRNQRSYFRIFAICNVVRVSYGECLMLCKRNN